MPLTLDQVIALSASAGSFAAALATYATVREMRQGRILSARARLTTPGTDLGFVFEWVKATKNLAPTIETRRIIIRNASSGVAHNIRVKWDVCFPFNNDDLSSIQRWMEPNRSIRIESPHLAEFLDGDEPSSRLIINRSDVSHLGDLGPNQEAYTPLSSEILSLVFLKWISLLTKVADGNAIAYTDVPLVKLTLIHDSPYEKSARDEHYVRFELANYRFANRQEKMLSSAIGGAWRTAQITLAFEPTSTTMYDIPKVVVGARTQNAG